MAHGELIQQNYFPELVDGLNLALNRELHASYVYLAMSAFFGRSEMGLHGFSSHFHSLSLRKRERAVLLRQYLTRRGAPVKLTAVERPVSTSWGSVRDAVEDALKVERWINSKILSLHYRALVLHDPSCLDFLDRQIIQQQVQVIQDHGDLITRLRLVGDKLGTIVVDMELLKVDVPNLPIAEDATEHANLTTSSRVQKGAVDAELVKNE